MPPPPEFVRGLLDNLCGFIGQPGDIPALVRVALIHYQFETIHPFLEGNGRLGRLILPVVLGLWGDLDLPLLYLSEFFEDHRQEYVDRMLAVSQRAAWKEWILFTLVAIESQANEAVNRGRALLTLREHYRQRYLATRSTSLVQVIDLLFERPSITVAGIAEKIGISRKSATSAIKTLVEDGVLTEATGFKRNRVFLAPEIIQAITHRGGM